MLVVVGADPKQCRVEELYLRQPGWAAQSRLALQSPNACPCGTHDQEDGMAAARVWEKNGPSKA